MASIAEILLAQGQNKANSIRERAGAWQPLIGQLANLPAQMQADKRAEQQRIQQQAEQAQRARIGDQTIAINQQRLTAGQQELDATTAAQDSAARIRKVFADPNVMDPRTGAIAIDGMIEASRREGADPEAVWKIYRDHTEAALKTAKAQRDEQDATRAASTRSNQEGIRRMIGDAIQQNPTVTPEQAQTYRGMAFQEGVTIPEGVIPETPKLTYLEAKPFLVNGRRTVLRQRSDGKFIDPKGNVVDNPQPDVPPSDGGGLGSTQWAKDPRDGVVKLMTPTEIRQFGAGQPETADMRNKEAGKRTAARAVDAVRKLGEGIITKVGPAQRADAIKRGAAAVFGNDPAFQTYQDSRMALAGTLAVEQQGARVSDADVKALWLPMVPDAYRDTAESYKLKWDLINTMRGVQTPGSGGGGGGAGRIYYDANGNPIKKP